ncbi:MAG: tripartite tricarboxylate transporter TctB family protein [Thermodesulfobacteriota bacterium]
MKGGVSILIAIIVVMAICLGIASHYPYLQAKIAPMLVGAIVLALSVVELARELRRGKKEALSKREPQKAGGTEKFRSYLREASWLLAFYVLIYLVGFITAIAVFTAAYAKAHQTRWSTSIALGVLMAGLSYLLFSYLVDTELYPGFIFKHLGQGV